MIRKSVIVCVLLIAGWSLFTTYVFKQDTLLHQWQGNITAAEKYIYTDSAIQNVMVGSSLSDHIMHDSVPGIYKLTFAGQSIYDGLNIILHKQAKPRYVFIETNRVISAESDEFRDALFSPLSFYPKKYLPGLRSNKQPLSMAGTFIVSRAMEILYFKLLFLIDKLACRTPAGQPNKVRQDFFTNLIEMKKKDYTGTIKPENLAIKMNLLKSYVDTLQQSGVTVIFFEMPINKDLVDLPFNKIIRNAMSNSFPATRYNYIALPPDYNTYITGDGVHLTTAEARNYSGYFKTKASGLLHTHP